MYKLIKKISGIIIIGILLCTLLAESPVFSEENKTVVYASPYDILPTDIFSTWIKIVKLWQSAVLVGLYKRSSDEGYRFIPVLASREPTIELLNKTETGYAMRLIITLKSGITFSDGTPITADDVKYTYYLHLTPKLKSAQYNILKYNFPTNDSIIVKDTNTIIFYFANQDAFYYSYLSIGIVPKNIYEPELLNNNFNFADPIKYVIGAGPYKLTSFEKTEDYSYTASLTINEKWVENGFPTPKIDALVFKKIGTAEEAISEFSNNKVDILDSSYKLILEDYNNMSNAKIERISGTSIQELSLNNIHPIWGRTAQLDLFLNKTFSYYNGKTYLVWSFWDRISNGKMNESQRIEAARLVREAISHSIPREILNNYTYNFSEPAPTIAPRGSIGIDADLKPREYSIEKAMDIIISAFELAGWKNITTNPNDRPEITGKYFVGNLSRYFPEWNIILMGPNSCGSTIYADTLYLLKDSFTKIGVYVNNTVSVGWDVIAPRTFNFNMSENDYNLPNGLHTPVPLFAQGGFDALLVGYYYGLEWNPYGIFDTYSFLPHGLNFYNWWDSQYDLMIEAYIKELNYEKRIELGKQLDDYFYYHQPSIPLLSSVSVWVYYEGITGLDLLLLSIGTQEWWKLDKQIITNTSTNQRLLPLEFLLSLLAIGLLSIIMRKYRK